MIRILWNLRYGKARVYQVSERTNVCRPKRVEGDFPRAHFRRGKTKPKGVVWFGVTSFWGHLRHFLASAIATEDVDSRDWMSPDVPSDLVARIASRLSRPRRLRGRLFGRRR